MTYDWDKVDSILGTKSTKGDGSGKTATAQKNNTYDWGKVSSILGLKEDLPTIKPLTTPAATKNATWTAKTSGFDPHKADLEAGKADLEEREKAILEWEDYLKAAEENISAAKARYNYNGTEEDYAAYTKAVDDYNSGLKEAQRAAEVYKSLLDEYNREAATARREAGTAIGNAEGARMQWQEVYAGWQEAEKLGQREIADKLRTELISGKTAELGELYATAEQREKLAAAAKEKRREAAPASVTDYWNMRAAELVENVSALLPFESFREGAVAARDEARAAFEQSGGEYARLRDEATEAGAGSRAKAMAESGIANAGGRVADLIVMADDILRIDPENQDWALIGKLAQSAKAEQEHAQEQLAKTTRNMSKAGKIAMNMGVSVVEQLPYLVMLRFGGGGSTAASMGLKYGADGALQLSPALLTGAGLKGIEGTLHTAGQVMGSIAKNPSYWHSFLTTVGTGYNEVREYGADKATALQYALMNAAINAGIEVGGGLEAMPSEVWNKPTGTGMKTLLKDWLVNAKDEGMEEIKQGLVERMLQNLVAGADNKWFGLSDREAVFTLFGALDEFAGGFVAGGILEGIGSIGNITTALEASQAARKLNAAALNIPEAYRPKAILPAEATAESVQAYYLELVNAEAEWYAARKNGETEDGVKEAPVEDSTSTESSGLQSFKTRPELTEENATTGATEEEPGRTGFKTRFSPNSEATVPQSAETVNSENVSDWATTAQEARQTLRKTSKYSFTTENGTGFTIWIYDLLDLSLDGRVEAEIYNSSDGETLMSGTFNSIDEAVNVLMGAAKQNVSESDIGSEDAETSSVSYTDTFPGGEGKPNLEEIRGRDIDAMTVNGLEYSVTATVNGYTARIADGDRTLWVQRGIENRTKAVDALENAEIVSDSDTEDTPSVGYADSSPIASQQGSQEERNGYADTFPEGEGNIEQEDLNHGREYGIDGDTGEADADPGKQGGGSAELSRGEWAARRAAEAAEGRELKVGGYSLQHEYTPSEEDRECLLAAHDLPEATKVVFFTGEVRRRGMVMKNVNGTVENGVVYLRADDPDRDIRQTAKHERWHLLCEKDAELGRRGIEALNRAYTPEELEELVAVYRDIYEIAYGVRDDNGNIINGGEVEQKVLQEICADAFARIAEHDIRLPVAFGEVARTQAEEYKAWKQRETEAAEAAEKERKRNSLGRALADMFKSTLDTALREDAGQTGSLSYADIKQFVFEVMEEYDRTHPGRQSAKPGNEVTSEVKATREERKQTRKEKREAASQAYSEGLVRLESDKAAWQESLKAAATLQGEERRETVQELSEEYDRLSAEEARLEQLKRISEGKVSLNVEEESNHIDQRDPHEMGSRDVKAFGYDHPELHPYYADYATVLLNDLNNVTIAQDGVQAAEAVAWLRDECGLSYAQIEEACKAIINGTEGQNTKAAKQVEIALDGMLSNGYTSMIGSTVSPDEEYIAAKSTIPGAYTADENGEYEGEEDELPLSIAESFDTDFRTWIEDGKPNEKSLYVGRTSRPLKSIGVSDSRIFWDTSKINKIQRDHPEMGDSVLQQVPQIIENPIIVMESVTQPNRLTMLSEVTADNGIPVMAVLELLPISRGGYELNEMKLVNAYTKDKGAKNSGTQSLINGSNILYIDADKKRTDSWLSHNQLQLPLGISSYGSIGRVSLFHRDVNGNFSSESTTDAIPEWKRKLIDAQDDLPLSIGGASDGMGQVEVTDENGNRFAITRVQWDWLKQDHEPGAEGINVTDANGETRFLEVSQEQLDELIKERGRVYHFPNKNRAEEIARAETNGYPMLETEDGGSVRRAVPFFTIVKALDRNNYGVITGVNENGTVEVYFANKKTGNDFSRAFSPDQLRIADRSAGAGLPDYGDVPMDAESSVYTAEDEALFREYENKRSQREAAESKYPHPDELTGEYARNSREQDDERNTRPTSRSAFGGTEATEKAGIRISGSLVGNWSQTDMLRAQNEGAKLGRENVRMVEKYWHPSKALKSFSQGVADGTYTLDQTPPGMNRQAVEELSAAYKLQASAEQQTLREQRHKIARNVQRAVSQIFADSEAYKPEVGGILKPFSKVLMNERTPERVLRSIFGAEVGARAYNYLFRPMYENNAEKVRWMNRQKADVETIPDSRGRKRALTDTEKEYAQYVLEGRGFEYAMEKLEQYDKELVQPHVEAFRQRLELQKDENYSLCSDWVQEIADEELSVSEARALAEEQGCKDLFEKVLENSTVTASLRKLPDELQRIADGMNWYAQRKAEMEARKDADQVIVENAAKLYGEKYDLFYKVINEHLVMHGYDEIGYIEGYAPHMQKRETQSKTRQALSLLGIQLDDVSELPASIAGRTAEFKPNMRWNPHFQHRTGGRNYESNIVRGFESYLDYMGDILYHTDDIMKLREAVNYYRSTYASEEIAENLSMANIVREGTKEEKAQFLQGRGLAYAEGMSAAQMNRVIDDYISAQYDNAGELSKYSEFTTWLENAANIMAGKQSLADRGLEYSGGRKMLGMSRDLMRAFSAANVAGSLSSVLNQTAQLPLIVTRLGEKYTARAIMDIASGRVKSEGFSTRSDYLTGKKGVDMIEKGTTGERFLSALFKPAGVVDELISTVAVRGEYLRQLDKGMSEESALRRADDFGRRIMGSRVKGEKPQGFESKRFISQMFHVFQVECMNTWDYVATDMPQEIRDIEERQGKNAAVKAAAAAIVGYLLRAFLLNRVAEETYGGTPANMDLFGMTAGFFASGRGLPTNKYLLWAIDNGTEKLTEERIFGTEREDGSEDFDSAKALKDLAYDVSNDLPYLRNAAGIAGIGDQTLPTVGINEIAKGAQNIWKGALGADGKPGGRDAYPLQMVKGTLDIAAQTLPMGRQAKKTVTGALTMAQGGSYSGYGDKARLQYAVPGSVWNWSRALLFGPGALGEQEEFYAGEGKTLTAAETWVYKALRTGGMDTESAYAAMKEYDRIGKDKGMSSTERAIAKRNLLSSLDVVDPAKLEAWLSLEADGNEDNGKYQGMLSLMEQGAAFGDLMSLYNRYQELESDDNLKPSEKATRFAAAVDELAVEKSWNEAMADEAKDVWEYRVSTVVEPTAYEKLMDTGKISTNESVHVQQVWAGLKPESGKESVSTVQQLYGIDVALDTEEKRWAAAETLMDTETEFTKSGDLTEYGKLIWCRGNGVDFETYCDARRDGLLEGLTRYGEYMDSKTALQVTAAIKELKPKDGKETVSTTEKAVVVCALDIDEEYKLAYLEDVLEESSFRKLDIATDYGVSASVWGKYMSIRERYDANGNGSYTQAEVQAAIESMRGLNTRQRAALWSMATLGKNNPFDRALGAEFNAKAGK